MLSNLTIENIAVVEKAELRFAGGFNVLTGETGAGKSVVVNSLLMLAGERISREIIRKGAKAAYAAAEFDSFPQSLHEELCSFGISPDEDGRVIVGRELTRDGKSNCRVNGRPVTLSLLKQLAKSLINIHGQNQNQGLLNPETHLGFLDAFAQNCGLLEEYEGRYDETAQILKDLNALLKRQDERERRAEYLAFHIGELKAANLKEGEDQELLARLKYLSNAESIASALEAASSALYGAENGGSAYDALSSAVTALGPVADSWGELKKLSESLSEIYYLLEGAVADLREIRSASEFDPGEMQLVSERLDLLSRLKIAYKKENSVALMKLLSDFETELLSLQGAEDEIIRLKEKYEESKGILRDLAERLTKSRTAAARELEGRIASELLDLDMPNVRFEIEILNKLSADGKRRLARTGRDEVRFLISPNKGEDLKELSKIASGGELSRIMLSFENVLRGESPKTLVFDEIDAGVSGRAAQKMAQKMYDISKHSQVVCVTHLPQIASVADRHFLIEKSEEGDRTRTKIMELSGEGREKEIARMISGIKITELTLKSAKEMLQLAGSQKMREKGVS